MKKTILSLLLLGSLIFNSCQSDLLTDVESIKAVPEDVILLIETEEPGDAFARLSDNELWNIIESEESIKGISTQLRSLEKYFKKNKFSVDNANMLISIHKLGVRSFDYLILLNKDDIDTEDFTRFEASKKAQKKYDKAEICEYSFSSVSSPFYIADYMGVIIISRNQVLVEKSILQLNSKDNLLNEDSFSKLYYSANKKEDFNIFLNIPQLYSFENYTTEKDFVLWTKTFGEWMELDLSPGQSEVFMSGVSSVNDSLVDYLSIFKDMKAQEVEVDKILPSTVAFANIFTFNNFEAYHKGYKSFLRKKGELNRYENKIKQHNIRVGDLLTPWIDNQIAYASILSDNRVVSYNDLIVIKSKDNDLALKSLELISDKSASDFRDFQIKKINKPDIMFDYLGDIFKNQKNPYYCFLGDNVVFSDNLKIIKSTISDYIDGRSLGNYKHFDELKSELASKSSILFYYKNPDFYKSMSRVFPKISGVIAKNSKELDKLKSGALQINFDNNIAFTNIIIKENVEVEKEIKSNWEVDFDNELYTEVHSLKNHVNGEQEIAVQDKSNTLYLISASGRTIWEKKIDGKILGEIKQVDIYKNRKLQMAFVAGNKLYVLDRNGNNVENFPVSLKSEITAPLAVFDYSDSRDYRFVVAAGADVYMYDKRAKRVGGFQFSKASSAITKEAQHFRIKGVDYIVIASDDGSIYVVDRRGNSKFKVKNKYPLGSNPFYLVESSNLKKSKIVNTTKNGELLGIYFNSSVDLTKMDDFNADTRYLQKSGHTVSISNSTLKWANSVSSEIKRLDGKEFTIPQLLSMKKSSFILFGSADEKKIHLFDVGMKEVKGFPLHGQYTGKVTDYNKDGKINIPVIVNEEKGNLRLYSLN